MKNKTIIKNKIMNTIKIYNSNELFYFDDFKVTDLILLKTSTKNEYLMMFKIKSNGGVYSDDKIAELQQLTGQKINNELESIWTNIEVFCKLKDINQLDNFEMKVKDCDDISLYFGWHKFLTKIRFSIKKEADKYLLNLTAKTDDVLALYEDEDFENTVEINCHLNLHIFQTAEEWHQHEKLY